MTIDYNYSNLRCKYSDFDEVFSQLKYLGLQIRNAPTINSEEIQKLDELNIELRYSTHILVGEQQMTIHDAATGDLPNEKVNFCRKCKANGYPHEAISFRMIGDGRLKTDGSCEFKTFQIVNYANDSPHEHRQK